ncbi:MAG TPA: hypothetical protein VHO48_06150, partial [Anaerolineaceae bacterium]|nr:hypothetical protein [Anaerolineaceae bacterium]
MITKRSVLLFIPYLVALAVLLFAAWTVWLTYLNPIPATETLLETLGAWFDRLSPVLIGLIFWLPGVLVLAFSHHLRRAVYMFVFCQAMCLTLITGVLSELGYPWAHILYWVILVWTGPVTVQGILALLAPAAPPKSAFLLRVVYGTA